MPASRHASIAIVSTAFFAALFVASAPAQQSRTATLANAPGRAAVEAHCNACHNAAMITNSSGYTRDQWEELVSTMTALSPASEIEILDYLAAHYPPSHNPRPSTIVAGPLNVSFQEWFTPQLGQRARDPVEAPDGMYWYVGQRANTIGRIDPATGDIREWLLPAGALPHSVNVDRQGRVWYTGNGNGTIGLFDPATGDATEYHMPDASARDPHTAEFDAHDILWFTLQQSNMIGRFDPQNGDIRLVTIARQGARPYGIKIAADGTPWVACNGSNCLIRVNPQTMALTFVDLPGRGSHVRRLDIGGDGRIWYVNSGRGRLGVYDPRNGAIREWASPSGPNSHPYAIAVINGVVWYNESGVRPDLLVRFDPATETFQSWAIPSGGIYAGIVRHMRATHDGRLLLHQSSTNRIILATLPE